MEPLFNGEYPSDMVALYDGIMPKIGDGDMKAIKAELDYLGINIYRRSVIAAGDEWAPINYQRAEASGVKTAMGWEVHPKSIDDIVSHIHAQYHPKSIYITENGAAFPDQVEPDGSIQDYERAQYLVDHLHNLSQAIERGVPVKGYFAWTLMDNFEWAEGYEARFGLVHVDFKTQRRTIKASGDIYAQICRSAIL
jgi:beta-glucosidase